MKKIKFLRRVVALLAIAVVSMSVFTGQDLDVTLSNLRRELYHDYRQIDKTRQQLNSKYEDQHQKMVTIMKKCNDMSLMLYSQKQDYTFDISYALERVTQEFNDFDKNRTPYERIVANLDIEIARYARLIESLRRLPPEIVDLEVVPDSLAYRNDTLDAYLSQTESLLKQELQGQVDSFLTQNAVEDTVVPETASAFVLSKSGQIDRDSCIFYASELLKMYAETRELVMADSTYYREVRLRMEESYQYARDYYGILENKVFVEGQIPWWTILSNPRKYWKEAWESMGEKYSLNLIKVLRNKQFDYESEEITSDDQMANSLKFYWLLIYLLAFFIIWGLAALLLLPVYRFVKPIGKRVSKEQKRYIALLLGAIIFIILSYESSDDALVRKGISVTHTFMWLLVAINTALLIRLEPSKLKSSVRLYMPTIFLALFVIAFRLLFVPNAFMNFFFPLLLFVMMLWQLVANLRHSVKADRTDMVIGWVSFGITAAATLIGWCGFVFLSLIILVWWYFQLAIILAIVSVWNLILLYKKVRLNKRISAYKEKLSYVTESVKEQMLFGATWFYDLIRDVLIPVIVLCSIPTCVYWALDIFEFKDLYLTIFEKPFFSQGGFRISIYNILLLAAMFYIFRYANKGLHTLWQTLAYRHYLRKHNKKAVRNNEINLSLGNSLISVFVWFVYADLVIITLNIPTGSLGLVAGGLSAGIGLALKDIINNFIYGIQLMGGRLRVGDWIECDGVRGKVTSISYQSTQIETIPQGTEVSFLNADLFGKNFHNLTKSNSYEYTKIIVGIAYGTNFQHVREIILQAMEVLKTKDNYGRDVVEPQYGIRVRFEEFGDSAVEVAVKQHILVPERLGYIDRAKEVIYKALNENGITIPFPQCDVHMIKDE